MISASPNIITPFNYGSSIDLTEDLVEYWKIDETASGSNVTRVGSLNLYNLTSTGNVPSTTGIINNGAIGGSNRRLSNASFPSLIGGDFTVSFWFQLPVTTGLFILGKTYQQNSADADFMFTANSSLKSMTFRTANLSVSTPNSKFVYNTWYHIVGLFDKVNGFIKLILNSLDTYTTVGVRNTSTSASPLALFGSNAPTIDDEFIGPIDEVGIWSRVLSSVEIETLYNNGSGISYPFS